MMPADYEFSFELLFEKVSGIEKEGFKALVFGDLENLNGVEIGQRGHACLNIKCFAGKFLHFKGF